MKKLIGKMLNISVNLNLKFAINKQYIKKSTIPNLTEFTVSGGNSRSRDEVLYMYKDMKAQPKYLCHSSFAGGRTEEP